MKGAVFSTLPFSSLRRKEQKIVNFRRSVDKILQTCQTCYDVARKHSKKKGIAWRRSPSSQRALEAEAFKNPQNRSDCCRNRRDSLRDWSELDKSPSQIFGHWRVTSFLPN